ncbi:MAG: lytic murein transglycosylase, partial [Pseudolabrys sp.]
AAQSGRVRFADVTGALPPPRPAHVNAPAWSGRSGASGDPRMTAQAIRAAAADFHQCLERMWPLAARHHVSRATFERYTRRLKPALRIMDLMDHQPEFTKSIWDYLDILVNDDRIEKGRALLAQYRPVFDRVERAYGVDRNVLAAIWGVESNYGTQGGNRPVLQSTATLACVGRRQKYFRREFVATLQILQHRDVPSDRLVGSWAGAFGPTQFMPSALVPANFNFMLATHHRTMPIREWERLGLRRPHGKPFPRPDDKAYLLVPAGVQGPGFLMLHNFRVIMRYNPAEAYALAIGHLADRLAGGGPFAQSWPRYEHVLSREQRLEMQRLLARHGYDVGEPDGRLGARTRAAIRQFQARNGRVPDGFASTALLKQLRSR